MRYGQRIVLSTSHTILLVGSFVLLGCSASAWQTIGRVSTAASQASSPSTSQEVSLFDGRGQPTAYVAPQDEMTIYLWSGEPVAYLVPDGGDFAVYSNAGRHLGWFAQGVMRDTQGAVVGAVREAFGSSTSIEPMKGAKSVRPMRAAREIAGIRPLFTNGWSSVPLSAFLTQ